MLGHRKAQRKISCCSAAVAGRAIAIRRSPRCIAIAQKGAVSYILLAMVRLRKNGREFLHLKLSRIRRLESTWHVSSYDNFQPPPENPLRE